MEILRGGDLKRFDEIVAGSLVVFASGTTPGLGIILEFNGRKDPVIAALVSDDEPHPRILDENSASLAIDLGTDWAIEPVDTDDSYPGHHETDRRAGLLCLSRNGWLMNFATSGVDPAGRFAFGWRNIATFESLEPFATDACVFYSHWKLWERASDRNLANGKPRLEFLAKPTHTHR